MSALPAEWKSEVIKSIWNCLKVFTFLKKHVVFVLGPTKSKSIYECGIFKRSRNSYVSISGGQHITITNEEIIPEVFQVGCESIHSDRWEKKGKFTVVSFLSFWPVMFFVVNIIRANKIKPRKNDLACSTLHHIHWSMLRFSWESTSNFQNR